MESVQPSSLLLHFLLFCYNICSSSFLLHVDLDLFLLNYCLELCYQSDRRLEQGAVLQAVHRVLKFKQEAWIESIHDHTDEYPLCSQHLDINQDMISDISKEIRLTRGGKSVFTGKKLAPNLFNNIEQGAVLKKIQGVLKSKRLG